MPPDVWILDTHIWIRYLSGDPILKKDRFLFAMEEKSRRGGLKLAGISLWETAMLCAKGRLQLDRPLAAWIEEACALPGLEIVPITPAIAVDSATLPGAFHGDQADRLIAATARVVGGTLLTLDRQILGYAAQGWVRALNPMDLG